mgnify:FL=1
MKKTGKNNGFTTPENYFDGLTDRLLDKIAQEDAVIPKNDGFKIPDGYLENLNATIMHKVADKEPKVVKLNSIKKYYYLAASIAAVVVLYFTIPFGTDATPSFDDLASTDIEHYFNETEVSLSNYDLAEFLPLDSIQSKDMMTAEITDEQVTDYLDHSNTIDELDLYLEDYE